MAPELRLPPNALERVIGQLINAGVGEPAAIAAHLGLEQPHVQRPLRALHAGGLLWRDARGHVRLTPAGCVWLAIEPPDLAEAGGERALPAPAPAPQLQPLHLIPEGDAPGVWEPPPRRAFREPPLAVVCLVARRTWSQLPLGAARGVGALAALGISVVLGVQLGLPTSPAASGGARVLDVTPTTATVLPAALRPPAITASPRVPPTSTPPAEHWVRVVGTDGLGLLLRPIPGSAERVRTLPEGTRLRVTGRGMQTAGREWLPVEAPSGLAGWVAGDYVTRDP